MTQNNVGKICFFNSCKTWGGGEKWYFEVAKSFFEKNGNIVVYTNKESELYNRLLSTKIETRRVKIYNLSFLSPFKLLFLIYQFKKQSITTIIVGLSSDLKVAGLAAKLAGVKCIIYRRGLANPIKNNFLNRLYFKHITSKVVVNSKEIRRSFLNRNPMLINPDKLAVIYNGIDLNKYASNASGKHTLNGEIVLGNVGRLIEEKGQKYLIDLAKNLKSKNLNFLIKIAGSGKLRASLEIYAKSKDVLDRIVFLEFLENTDQFYQEIDIFVFPSISEGFSNALLEAMAFGLPSVGWDISSLPELIENDYTGYLVNFGDVEEFCSRVATLIQNKELRDTMGQNARQKILQKFDFQKSVLQLEELIKEHSK